jgi:hypothetical protein
MLKERSEAWPPLPFKHTSMTSPEAVSAPYRAGTCFLSPRCNLRRIPNGVGSFFLFIARTIPKSRRFTAGSPLRTAQYQRTATSISRSSIHFPYPRIRSFSGWSAIKAAKPKTSMTSAISLALASPRTSAQRHRTPRHLRKACFCGCGWSNDELSE